MSGDDLFFSRSELLGGLPTRQASTLLFAIESRTAHLKQESRVVASRFRVEKSSEQEEHTFFRALSEGREAQSHISIQDLERYASGWASLIPQGNTGMYAALAHLLGEKYTFTSQSIPYIREILALDTVAVKDAYQTHYKHPLEDIYVQEVSRREQLKWLWSHFARRLENLPPFWIAFSLTITETAGASILALPIAITKVGIGYGLVLLIVLGLANMLTLAALVEAITRNGNMRYGSAYFGHLVGDYLGKAGVVILSVSLLLLIVLVLIAFYIGISTTLEEATSIPSTVWVVAIFFAGFYFLHGKSLNSTIASAIFISVLNIGIILILVILAFPYINTDYLQFNNTPFSTDAPFDPSIIELIFGVILASYFGHTSAANAAKVVLRQDPSGRALVWGNIWAMLAVIGLYCLWTVVIVGTVAPDVLANTTGTSLTPLAEIIGPSVSVLGSIFVILGMGMGTVHFSLALFNQIGEWLPEIQDSKLHSEPQKQTSSLTRILLTPNGRFWISIIPIVLIALLVEWLILTNQESFTKLLGIVGVITVPLLSGIFPILMLLASRQKGEYIPGKVFNWLGHPITITSMYLLFFISILLHGLIIWEDPLLRIIALFICVVIAGVTIIVMRNGAFAKFAVIEVRVDQNADELAFFGATIAGKPFVLDVELNYANENKHIQTASGELPRFNRLRSLTIDVPPIPVKNLKLWVHRITNHNVTHSIPSFAEIYCGDSVTKYDLEQSGGQIVMNLAESTPYRVTISLSGRK